MKFQIYLLAVALSFPVFAQNGVEGGLKNFREPFWLFTRECRNTAVDMRSGSIVNDKGDSFTVFCKPTADIELSCNYLFDDQKKTFKENSKYFGGISGAQAALQNKLGDEIIINLTSQVFQLKSELNLADGLIRGAKICSGSYMTETEAKRVKNKK